MPRDHLDLYWKGKVSENDDQDIRIILNERNEISTMMIRVDLGDQNRSMIFLQHIIQLCEKFSLKFMSPQGILIAADLKSIIDHIIQFAFPEESSNPKIPNQ